MNMYDKIMEIAETEKEQELLCAKESMRMMRKTLNPIRKLRLYFGAKRFKDHVVRMDLLIYQIKKHKEELSR